MHISPNYYKTRKRRALWLYRLIYYKTFYENDKNASYLLAIYCYQ